MYTSGQAPSSYGPRICVCQGSDRYCDLPAGRQLCPESALHSDSAASHWGLSRPAQGVKPSFHEGRDAVTGAISRASSIFRFCRWPGPANRFLASAFSTRIDRPHLRLRLFYLRQGAHRPTRPGIDRRMPQALRRATSWTSLSARSIFGAPFCNARAAEAGRDRLCAASAYFSNGTRSDGLAPSFTQRSNTKL